MVFLFKLLLWVVVLGVGGGLVINHLPDLKTKVMEIVNPAVKQARVLGDASTKLTALQAAITAATATNDSSERNAKLAEGQTLIHQMTELLVQADDISKNTGVFSAAAGQVAETLINSLPATANNLLNFSQSSTPSVSPIVCPPQ